ncbi:hypothetical protein BO443_40444 [Burkholderia orbicola]
MEILDAFKLARLQFTFTISFHIIFPLISLGFCKFFRRIGAAMAEDGSHRFRTDSLIWRLRPLSLGNWSAVSVL